MLIECTDGDQHQLLSDEKAVVQSDYGVELVPNDRQARLEQAVNIFNCTYPSPGTYFVDEQRIYFLPCCFSTGEPYYEFEDDQFVLNEVQTIVIEQIPPFMFPSKEEPKDQQLPANWGAAKDRNGFVYYFNRLSRKVQWSFPTAAPPEPSPEEGSCIAFDALNQEDPIKNVVISSADSTSTPRLDCTEAVLDPGLAARLDSLVKMPEECPSRLSNGEKELVDSLQNHRALPSAFTQLLSSITSVTADLGQVKSEPSEPDLQGLPMPDRDCTGDSLDYESIIRLSGGAVGPTPLAGFNKLSERKLRDKFKAALSEHIKSCLNPYRRFDCKVGRILSNDDFKFLARKVR